MEEDKKTESNSFLDRYDTVIAFLSIEAIALICFGFAGATGLTVLRLVGLFIGVIGMPYALRSFTDEGKKKYWLGLIPFFVFALLTGMSRFWMTAYSGSIFSIIITNLTVTLGIVGAFFLGQSLRSMNKIKKDYILLGVAAGLGLYVLITFLYSMIRYGFFYVARFSGMVYYYNGILFPVDAETKFLNGFAFEEIALSAGLIAATILACALPAVLFVNQKENKKKTILFFAISLLGLLDLVCHPFKGGLIIVAIVWALGILIYFSKRFWKIDEQKKDKIFRIGFYSLIGLISVGIIVYFYDAIAHPGNSMFGRQIITNAERLGYLVIFEEKGASDTYSFNFLGILFGSKFTGDTSRFFEINYMYHTGLLGLGLLLYFIFRLMQHGYYFLKKKEDMDYKMAIVLVLIAIFIYMTIYDKEAPLVHSTSFMPFTRSTTFLLVVFLGGLIVDPKNVGLGKKLQTEEIAHE